MQATGGLVAEHRVIERALRLIQQAANRLYDGESASPAVFVEAAEFFRSFADVRHHHEEEDLLFPALVQAGMSLEQAPLSCLLADHERGRRCVRRMKTVAARLARGDERACHPLVLAVRDYVYLLSSHIHEEDFVLFPRADAILPDTEKVRLARCFAELDAGEPQALIAQRHPVLFGLALYNEPTELPVEA